MRLSPLLPLLLAAHLVAQTPTAADLAAQLDRWFAADDAGRTAIGFDPALDAELCTPAGDARLRQAVAAAWRRGERALLSADHERRRVHCGGMQSAFTVERVGIRPIGGWPLVIALHGGGGVPPRVNDAQWRQMQVYYRAQPGAGGYLYCALRAPNDEWNGFYCDGFYPLLEQLIRQFVVCEDVDPDRVVVIGYSHGGYGAFAVGPKLPHRFAAVHSSAAAPTDGASSALGLHTLAFSWMVGGQDTAHGRRERCERFAAAVAELQRQHPGHNPATFTLVEGKGHTGLPDRDLLARLVPHVRSALPRQVRWEATDTVVRDHYWLQAPAPRPGRRIDAALDGQRLSVSTGGAGALAAWLDARLVDLTRPLQLVVDGVVSDVAPAPSLRTLCATLQERGDPVLAASWVVALR